MNSFYTLTATEKVLVEMMLDHNNSDAVAEAKNFIQKDVAMAPGFISEQLEYVLADLIAGKGVRFVKAADSLWVKMDVKSSR